MSADHASMPVVKHPDGSALVAYIEDMVLQLAELASGAGETALAASLALVAIQAGAASDRRRPARREEPALPA